MVRPIRLAILPDALGDNFSHAVADSSTDIPAVATDCAGRFVDVSGVSDSVFVGVRDIPDDPRDLVPHRADVMVTGDPDLVEYASGIPEFRVLPLPWRWQYVLAIRSRRDMGSDQSGFLDASFSYTDRRKYSYRATDR